MRRFRAVVLCYHAVSEAWDDWMAVSLAALERQVRSLVSRGYRPANAGDVVASGGRVLHVTFDDAFRTLMQALPVLDRLGVPATVFVCSGLADLGRPLRVGDLVARSNGMEDELATMRWDELQAIVEHGVEVGSHTVTHARLTALTDGELAYELRTSKEQVEDELGRRCRFLAYPYGAHDGRVRRAARAAGYEAAFALGGRPFGGDDFAVPRVAVGRNDHPLRHLIKTSPAFRSAGALTARLRRSRDSVSS